MHFVILSQGSYKYFVYLQYCQNLSHHHRNQAHVYLLSSIYTKLGRLVVFSQHASHWYLYLSQFHVKYTKIKLVFHLHHAFYMHINMSIHKFKCCRESIQTFSLQIIIYLIRSLKTADFLYLISVILNLLSLKLTTASMSKNQAVFKCTIK